MNALSIVLLIIFGAMFCAFATFCLFLVFFIIPRTAGSIKVIKGEPGFPKDEQQSLCVMFEDEKDFEKLKKYSYIILKSNDYKSK